MKKLFSLICGIASIFMMTSCVDEDTSISIDLAGSWEGYFGMYYSYEDRYGYHEVTSDYSELEFIPSSSYSTHGVGHEVDYYNTRKGPYDYEYYYFKWEIINGVIYLTYPGARDLDVQLRDYRINNRVLTGHFRSGEPFSLDKYKSYYYDWHEDYCRYDCERYGWWYRHEWDSRCSKGEKGPQWDDEESETRSASPVIATDEAEDNEPRNVRTGRRFY